MQTRMPSFGWKQSIFSFAESSGVFNLVDRWHANSRNRLAVLNYHRVDRPTHRPWLDPGVVSTDPDTFETQMRLLAKRFQPVTLEEVLEAVQLQRPLPWNAALVTVDDGYRDFQEEIFPRAMRNGIRPVLFVTTGMVGSGAFWWDILYRAMENAYTSELVTPIGRFPVATPEERAASRQDLAERLKHASSAQFKSVMDALSQIPATRVEIKERDTLNWDELRALDRAGAYICAHTHTHPILSRIPLEEALAEVQQSQSEIGKALGHAWPVFAYPEGQPHAISEGLVSGLRELGFQLAFSTVEGSAQLDSDPPLCLPRIGVWPGLSLGQFHFHLSAMYRAKRPSFSFPTTAPTQSTAPKRFLLVQVWEKPPYEKSTARMLADAFPDYQMEIFPLGKMLKRRPDVLLWNGVQTWLVYGMQFLQRQQDFRVAFYGTPYLFRKTRELFLKQMQPRTHAFAFSIMIHSLFDVSIPDLPHFVYTDRTLLSNLQDPTFDRRKTYHDAWVKEERTIYQHAARIFTWSSNITRSLIEQYALPAEKVSCVYVGYNAQPSEGVLENDGYRNQHILFVGIDWARKGGPDLIRAFRQVRTVFPRARLTLVGPSIRLDEPGVRVTGELALEGVSKLFKTASIFCLPTTWEAFGIAYLEAMANQLPVIGTNLGAIPDFILPDQTGLLVQPRDADELAAALISLLQDPEKCQRMGTAGANLVRDRYNWERVGQKIRAMILASLTDE